MEATFKIQTKEFTEELLQKIKQMFEGKPVTITITTEMDDTEYLISCEANKQHLLESMASEPTISFTSEEFKKHTDYLLRKK
jgi:hypothetical protein